MHDMIKLKFACTRYASSPIALALMLCIFQHFWFERCHQLFFSNQLFSHWLHINPSFSKISWKQLEEILKWMKLIYKKKRYHLICDAIFKKFTILNSLHSENLHAIHVCMVFHTKKNLSTQSCYIIWENRFTAPHYDQQRIFNWNVVIYK